MKRAQRLEVVGCGSWIMSVRGIERVRCVHDHVSSTASAGAVQQHIVTSLVPCRQDDNWETSHFHCCFRSGLLFLGPKSNPKAHYSPVPPSLTLGSWLLRAQASSKQNIEQRMDPKTEHMPTDRPGDGNLGFSDGLAFAAPCWILIIIRSFTSFPVFLP